jgi:prepilin-type N-terminal cleavage/methylation domain-containing protein
MPPLDIELMHASPPRARGFTLIELAVVLFLVALLLGALLGPVTLRLEAEQRARAEAYLAEVKQALIGFALRTGRLPCTDTSGTDGLEDRTPPGCLTPPPGSTGYARCNGVGYLPNVNLGVASKDPWGRRLRYYVSDVLVSSLRECPDFAQNPAAIAHLRPNFLSLQSSTEDGDTIMIATRGGNRNLDLVARGVAAAILSEGGRPRTFAPPGSDELNNFTGVGSPFTAATLLRIRPPNREAVSGCDDAVASLPACHFDDIVDWLPLTVLQYHLVAAGHQL